MDIKRQNIYVEGNTVRREAVPRPRREQEIRQPEITRRVRRNREKIQVIGVPYLIILAFATVMVLGACVNYLQVQSSITAHRNNIKKLETSVMTMKADNNAVEGQIDTYVDLDYIRNVAMNEMGMVYPSDDQVIYYDKTESGYVRQYEDIPTD